MNVCKYSGEMSYDGPILGVCHDLWLAWPFCPCR